MVVVEVTKNNFEKEFEKSKTPVITDFWAAWCGPCRLLSPVFEELSKNKEYKGKLKFTKVNTEQEQEIANKFRILGIPCLVLSKKGKEFDRIVGFYPKEILNQKIKDSLKKA